MLKFLKTLRYSLKRFPYCLSLCRGKGTSYFLCKTTAHCGSETINSDYNVKIKRNKSSKQVNSTKYGTTQFVTHDNHYE